MVKMRELYNLLKGVKFMSTSVEMFSGHDNVKNISANSLL